MELRQQAESLFFNSGVQELYEHWHSTIPGEGSIFSSPYEWSPGEAPDTWAYQATVVDPFNSERLLKKVITYSVLYTAAMMITEEKVDSEKPFFPVSGTTGDTCTRWVFNDELDLFDPHTLDEVLQVAVYGGIRHPHFRPRDRS
jgi:hypothetical protein